MAAYNVHYHYTSSIRDLSNRDRDEKTPLLKRVSASNAQRAISAVVNDLKAQEAISSKADVVIVEVTLGN